MTATSAKVEELIARADEYKFDMRQPGAFTGVKLLSDLVKAVASLNEEVEMMRKMLEAIDAMPEYAMETWQPSYLSGLIKRYNKCLSIARAALSAREAK